MLLSNESELGSATSNKPNGTAKGAFQRRKALRDRLADIYEASKEAQKELFTRVTLRGAWRDCYTALSELRSLPKDPKVALGDLQRDLFKQIRSTDLGLLQRAVCQKEDVVVPTDIRAAILKGIPQLPKVTNAPGLYSLEGCTIDPRLIPVEVAVKLNLLKGEKRSREDEVLALSDPKVLVGFKFYIECSRRLGERSREMPNRCLRVIEPPSQSTLQRWGRVFKEVGFNPDPSVYGTILFFHEKPGAHEKRTAREPVDAKREAHAFFKPLQIQTFTSAYDAARKPHHQKSNYDGEYPALIALNERWANYRDTIHTRWVTADNFNTRLATVASEDEKAGLREELEAQNKSVLAAYEPLLKDSIAFFKGSKDPWKQDIRDRLLNMQRALQAETSASFNPICIDLQAKANSARTQERLKEVTGKDGRNTEDARLLQHILQAHTAIFRGIHSSIISNAHILCEPQRLFDASRLPRWTVPRERNTIRTKLLLGTDALVRVKTKPFVEIREALEKADKELDRALSHGNQANAQEALSKSFFITRAFLLHNALQIVRLGLAEPEMPVRKRVAAALKDLHENIGLTVGPNGSSKPTVGRQQTFSKPTAFEQSEIARQLDTDTKKVATTLIEIASDHHRLTSKKRPPTSPGPSLEETKAFIQSAKEKLDSFDFLQVIGRVVF